MRTRREIKYETVTLPKPLGEKDYSNYNLNQRRAWMFNYMLQNGTATPPVRATAEMFSKAPSTICEDCKVVRPYVIKYFSGEKILAQSWLNLFHCQKKMRERGDFKELAKVSVDMLKAGIDTKKIEGQLQKIEVTGKMDYTVGDLVEAFKERKSG